MDMFSGTTWGTPIFTPNLWTCYNREMIIIRHLQDATLTSDRQAIDQVREILRLKHYAYRTEQAYLDWIRRFVPFHGSHHPILMGVDDVERFISYLANERRVLHPKIDRPSPLFV